LEEGPRRFTRQVHVRAKLAALTPERLEQVHAIVSAHPGRVPLFLCLERPTGAKVFIEANDRCSVTPGHELQQALEALLGAQSYYPAVDTTLPERAPRRWERRNGTGAGGE
jgi:hypothetical protein